jgi:hypothetical protein
MPTYNSILNEVSAEETARYVGLRQGATFPAELIQKACQDVRAVASPKGSWETYDYDPTNCIAAADPLLLENKTIVSHLAGCQKIAILAVTIGAAVEKEALRLFDAGEYTAGLLLDAAGSTAVEAAVDQVNQLIVQQAAQAGFTATARFSPGYGDWEITVQPRILELAGGHRIGISTTTSCMLIPRKSVTAVIGFYEGAAKAPYPSCSNCIHCQKINCIARKEPCQL